MRASELIAKLQELVDAGRDFDVRYPGPVQASPVRDVILDVHVETARRQTGDTASKRISRAKEPIILLTWEKPRG